MRFFRPLLVVMGLALAAGSAHAQEKPFTDAKKAEIGEIVKSYLMSHPELIQEALNELDKKQRDAEAQAQKAAVASLSPDLIKAETASCSVIPRAMSPWLSFSITIAATAKKPWPTLWA